MSLYLLFQGFIFLFLPPGAAKIASLQVLPTALLGAPNRTRTSPSRTVPVWRRLTCATDHPYAGDRRPRPGPHPNLRRGFCRSRETPPRHSEATPRGRTRISRGGRCQSPRSEEHTSELQSLMRISYAVFCLTKKNTHTI